MSGKLEEVQSPTNPGEFDSKAYYGCQRIYYVMKKGKIKKQSQSHSAYGQFLIDVQQKFAGIRGRRTVEWKLEHLKQSCWEIKQI